MSTIEIARDVTFPEQFWTPEWKNIFTPDLLGLLARLHSEFEPERQDLLKARKDRQKEYDSGKVPEFLDRSSEAASGDWKVAPLPECLLRRRVEITGPVNSAKMVINMLSSGADMAMLDFEDSMKPSFQNVLDGYKNVIAAVRGELKYETPEKEYKLDLHNMSYVMVRARGLHLDEANIEIDGEPISAGLLDLAVCFLHTARNYLEQGKVPKFYIPKCEHYLEARWWDKVFHVLENELNLPVGTLRATFLIETLPATFQVEEILYEVRDHAAGLNVGRWDKIFSDIKVLRNHKDRIMGDRSSINMTRPWMENYAKRVIKICHEHGAFAMGGMSAFTPGKTETERFEQTKKVKEDKEREASWGHDGCWVSHPYFVPVALKAFTSDNQLKETLPDFDKYADVLPQGVGPYTMEGLRTNIRVGMAYLNGWNQDIGCVSFDNLMEDLATLEISRAQVWQWLHHHITLDDGTEVNEKLIHKLFDEEFKKIQYEIPSEGGLFRARQEAEKLFTLDTLPEFLSLTSEKGL